MLSRPLRDLDRRGLIKDCSGLAELDGLLASGRRIAVYAGFDPTAGSLHVGHLATLTVLRVFAAHGHEVLPVLGTATAMVGDPSGRTAARPLLAKDDVERNAAGVSESIRRGLGDARATFLRNGDWIGDAGLVDFLRDVGSRVALSKLLAQESVKSRLGDSGISFLEACYPLLQAWDFRHLAVGRQVTLQVGGSDQWSNICMGLDLIGRTESATGRAFGLTHPLLLDSKGAKMGKTTGGAVWLNPGDMDDYGFFRWWRTLPDADAPRIARMLSDLEPSKVDDAEERGGLAVEGLKEALALSMTARIRGEAAALAADAASRARGASAEGLREVGATGEEAHDLPALAVRAGLAASKGAARRLAAQGGLRVDGEPRTELALTTAELARGIVVLSAGRTRHCAVRFPPDPGEAPRPGP
jgi:tyrosyl-tRNA synthetase